MELGKRNRFHTVSPRDQWSSSSKAGRQSQEKGPSAVPRERPLLGQSPCLRRQELGFRHQPLIPLEMVGLLSLGSCAHTEAMRRTAVGLTRTGSFYNDVKILSRKKKIKPFKAVKQLKVSRHDFLSLVSPPVCPLLHEPGTGGVMNGTEAERGTQAHLWGVHSPLEDSL